MFGRWLGSILPGVLLCAAISAAAYAIQAAETVVVGHPFVEALVLAILLGTAVRSCWTPGPRWQKGIAFSARMLLEIAVMLLGASLSGAALAAAGPALLLGISAVVFVSLFASYFLGRLLGLPHPMALLIACGNSICGNSAIAAVASVIDASGDDVASSIAFTAILGVVVVLALPLLVPLLVLSPTQYGTLAGLTVYAVPQVLAATAPIGLLSVQVGTLVKLMRVLLLGPVVFVISLGVSRSRPPAALGGHHRVSFTRLVPWFIIGFVILAAARSLGLVPAVVLAPAATITTLLTVLAMAALGLAVDLRKMRQVGPVVTLAVTLSLLLLLAMSYGLIRYTGMI